MSKSEKLMGSLSPALGMATGKGFFGKLGAAGLIPGLANLAKKRKKKLDGTEDLSVSVDEDINTSGMKKGGKVSSASKRADGCAVRGKTKGRMV